MEAKKLTKAEQRRERQKVDRLIKNWKLKAAIKSGDEYFDGLLNSLREMVDDVKRNKKHWKDAVKKKTYPDGRQIRKEVIIQQIEQTVHSMGQFNKHTDKAMTALIKLTMAFDIDV